MSETPFYERPYLHETAECIGKTIFGSPKKMALGIWIVERDLSAPFSVGDAMEAYTGSKSKPDGQIGSYLKDWSEPEVALLERLREPHLRTQRYMRTESPLWGIFEAAKQAVVLND